MGSGVLTFKFLSQPFPQSPVATTVGDDWCYFCYREVVNYICSLRPEAWHFQMDLSAMTSKHKNDGYSVGTFVQKIAKIEAKTELIR